MSVPKKYIDLFKVEYVTKWEPPKEGEDMRALIAMPNIPKPTHGMAPRTLLGSRVWNQMRKHCYTRAEDTCEICGAKPDNLRHRHAHEVYSIDWEKGEVKFVRAFCVCALCHLGCIHTGRAVTLYKQGNPLYPKEFLLQGAEHAFKTISEYNQDHPDANLKAYATFLEYLKVDELYGPMTQLIGKYNVKFYMEDPKKMADWGEWKLIIGDTEFPTPYQSEHDWKEAMEERAKEDSARLLQKSAEEKFSGKVYDELENIIGENGDLDKPKAD